MTGAMNQAAAATADALDDEELASKVTGTRGREREQAFSLLFARHRRRILQLQCHLTGDNALAEDAHQETFLQVYRDLPAFRGDAQLGTWIYRIAIRTAIRVRARHAAHATRVATDAVDESHDDCANPEQQLVLRERVQQVKAAMQTLPIEQRAVLALFAVDGLGHAAIAEILGVPQGTVWSRLHQARKALTNSSSR